MKAPQILKAFIALLLIVCPILCTIAQTVDTSKYKVSKIEKEIKDIKIVVTQIKSILGTDPLCRATIQTFQNGLLIDSLNFSASCLDPVGDRYGVYVYDNIVSNHAIISKFGSYDSKAVIVNEIGKVFIVLGGFSYFDEQNNLLFSIHHSDNSGFSIFNLNNDKELVAITTGGYDRVQGFCFFKNEYFVETKYYKSQKVKIWKIDFKEQALQPTELNTLPAKETFKGLITHETVGRCNCQCE